MATSCLVGSKLRRLLYFLYTFGIKKCPSPNSDQHHGTLSRSRSSTVTARPGRPQGCCCAAAAASPSSVSHHKALTQKRGTAASGGRNQLDLQRARSLLAAGRWRLSRQPGRFSAAAPPGGRRSIGRHPRRLQAARRRPAAMPPKPAKAAAPAGVGRPLVRVQYCSA